VVADLHRGPEETGLRALADVNDHSRDTGLGPMPVNVVGTKRWNAAFAYLDAARGRPNLAVLDECLVDRIAFGCGRPEANPRKWSPSVQALQGTAPARTNSETLRPAPANTLRRTCARSSVAF
jgi:hypothetical protein